MRPCSPHRIPHPEGHRALEDITLHRQLRVLPPQPDQLRALVLSHRAAALTPCPPVLGAPVPQGALIDPQIPGHLRDRLPGLTEDPNRHHRGTHDRASVVSPSPPTSLRRCLHATRGSPHRYLAAWVTFGRTGLLSTDPSVSSMSLLCPWRSVV